MKPAKVGVMRRRAVVILSALVCATAGLCDDWPASDLPSTPGRHLFVSAGPGEEGDGSLEQPCRTICRAAELAQPGDTVWIRGGVYREAVRVRRSGSGPDRMLSFRAYPGERPVLKGSELLSGWGRCKDEPDRPIWETPWPWPGVYPSMICADEAPLTPCCFPPDTEGLAPPKAYCKYVIGFGRGREAMAPGSFWYDADRGLLRVWLKGGEDPNRRVMEAAIRASAWWSEGNYLRVEGLRVQQTGLVRPIGGVAFVMVGPAGGLDPAEGCIVRNCEVSLSAFEGMVVRGGARVTTVVEDCWVHHNGNGCGGFDGKGEPDSDAWLQVRRCRLTDNNLSNWNPSWHAGGKHFGTRLLFDRCEFLRHHNSPGVWFDCKTRDCIVNRCYAADNGMFGLYYEIGETGAFVNNVVEGAPHCSAIALNGSSRTLVAHNLVAAMERGIIVGWEGNTEGQTFRVTCYNSVLNNIVTGRSHPLITLSPESDAARGNSSDHNLLWQTPPAAWQTPGDGGHFAHGTAPGPSLDLPAWQAQRGMDTASRVAAPLLTRAGDAFRREPGSPASSGGRRLGPAEVEALFALRPMPEVQSEEGSASIRDHLPASPAFLRKVAELLASPEGADVPFGPIPDPADNPEKRVYLANGDFDHPVPGDGKRVAGAPSWEVSGGPAMTWDVTGAGLWNWPPPSGRNVLVIPAGEEESVAVEQTVGEAMRPEGRYRLSAWFGQRIDQADAPWPRVTLSLHAGERMLGSVDVPEPWIRPHHGVWVQAVLVVEPWDGRLPEGNLRVCIRRSGPGLADVCVDDVCLRAEPG